MTDRVYVFKGCAVGNVVLSAGHYYALPEDLTAEVLALGAAVREGSEASIPDDNRAELAARESRLQRRRASEERERARVRAVLEDAIARKRAARERERVRREAEADAAEQRRQANMLRNLETRRD